MADGGADTASNDGGAPDASSADAEILDSGLDSSGDAERDSGREGGSGGWCQPPLLSCDGGCVDPSDDPSNCGGCGLRCASDETCTPQDGGGYAFGGCQCTACSPPQVIAFNTYENAANANMAITDSTLYYSDSVGNVWEMPLDHSTPTKIFDLGTFDAGTANPYLGIGVLAVDATSVYAAVQTGPILAIKRDPPHPARMSAMGALQISGMALDATFLYYAESAKGTIARVSIAGGAPEAVVALEQDPEGLVLAGDNLVWTSLGTVRTAPKAGGPAKSVASGMSRALAAGMGKAYFGDSQSIYSFDSATGVVTPIASLVDWLQGIFVDGTDVIWTQRQDAVQRAPLAGGPTHTMADVVGSPWSVVASPRYVYWYDAYNLQILMAAR